MRPDVLHGHGAKGGVYARIFGTLLKRSGWSIARLYSPHGGSLHYDERTATGRFFFGIERQMERFTDHLLFVSEYERQAFRRKIGDPRAPNSLVYNGVREAEFAPVAAQGGAADLLYIGMMRDLKGPDLFIDAIAEAAKALGRPIEAVMVGAGADLPRYQAQAARLGLAERIRFLAPMPARQAFALARLIVVPSRAEAMPYIVLEALAAGKPMIASAVGGIPEIFGEASPALVRPFAGELAERMGAALADLPAYGRLMPSLTELKDRFGADVMASRIEAIYYAALERGGQHARP